MTDHSDLIAELRGVLICPSSQRDIMNRAASALSSQSLSLSEAREEIERLKARVNRLVDIGLHHQDRADAAEKALKPFAAIAGIFDHVAGNRPREGEIMSWVDHRVGERVLTVEALRQARSALENGPAGLADATSNPPLPDLSSLRKGAEALCPHAPTYDAGLCCGHPDDCTFVSPSGLSKWASATEDGIRAKLLRLAKALHAKHYAHVPQWEPFEDAYGLIDQIDNMTAALVSGSREDGDG